MDALTRLLGWLAPGLAARRLSGQLRLDALTRAYEAAKTSAYRPRRGHVSSADASVYAAGDRLREFARYLDENHDLAIGILDDLVTNIVGEGIGVEFAVTTTTGEPLERLNDELTSLWRDWWERPEVTGELSGPELERLVCRTWLRDGEVFVQHVTGRAAPYGSAVPYALEPIEADFVPSDYDLNGFRQGVLKDNWGRPLSYAVYKSHPGDAYALGGTLRPDIKYVSAQNLSHLKLAKRLHQTRGVTVLHGVLGRLDDLRDYEESERVAARVAAALTAYIKRSADLAPTESAESARSFEISPGMVWDNLQPGEEVGVINSERPNSALATFRMSQLRAAAAGTGTRGSAIARDFNGSYSSQRQELVEGTAHYRRLFSYEEGQFYLPVVRRFVDASRLAGLVRVPSNADLRTLYHPELRMPALPWIDPKKEIEAAGLAVEYGFRSRRQVIRDLGGDPREVDAQLIADTLDVRPLWKVDTDNTGSAGGTPKPPAPGDTGNPKEEAA